MIKWQLQNKQTVFETPIFQIEQLQCFHPKKNVKHPFYILKNPDWVNVVGKNNKGNLILVKQHRLGTDEFTIETVAGLINNNENPEKAALRELQEETGYNTNNLILLKKLSANPAIMNNSIYFYLALDSSKTFDQNLDLAEDIEVIELSEKDVINLIKEGKINHSIIITALTLYFLSPYCNIDKSEIQLFK